jgi:hypothetical protein
VSAWQSEPSFLPLFLLLQAHEALESAPAGRSLSSQRGCQLLPPTHLCPTHRHNQRPKEATVSGLLRFFHLMAILTCCALSLSTHHIARKRKLCDCGAKNEEGNVIIHSNPTHRACLKGKKQKGERRCVVLSRSLSLNTSHSQEAMRLWCKGR